MRLDPRESWSSPIAAIRRRLAVLRNPEFRRLLAGRSVSFLGDGLYAVAAMWLVYELTGSTAYTGLAGALTRAPSIFRVLVGPVVDRARLDRLLTLSEVGGAAVALVVPVAFVLGYRSVVVVLATIPLVALSGLFAAPAQNATLPRIVDEESLVRANSVFSVVTNAVDAAARAVAGAIIAAFGAVTLYAIDAATFAVAALLFAGLSVPARERDPDPLDLAEYRTDLREGFDLLTGSVAGRMLVASLFANFLGGVAFAVLPAFAASIGGPQTYGLLVAGITVGGVLGSVAASTVDHLPFGQVTAVGFAVSGAVWIVGVLVAGPVVATVLFAASRLPVGVYNVSVMATFQTGVPDDLLGRVTAATSSASNIVRPLGLLIGGLGGELVGARAVMLADGIGSLLMAAYWLLIPSLRRFGPPTAVTPETFAPSTE